MRKDREKKKPFLVHLDPDTLDLMHMLSDRTGMSLSLITRKALADYLEDFRDAVRVAQTGTAAARYQRRVEQDMAGEQS